MCLYSHSCKAVLNTHVDTVPIPNVLRCIATRQFKTHLLNSRNEGTWFTCHICVCVGTGGAGGGEQAEQLPPAKLLGEQVHFLCNLQLKVTSQTVRF